MMRERRKNLEIYLVECCVTLDGLAVIACFSVVQNIHLVLNFQKQICVYLKESMTWELLTTKSDIFLIYQSGCVLLR